MDSTPSTLTTSGWLPAASDPPILFGHYQIVGILGKGGMGTVFEGYHLNLKRYVAIKTLRIDLIHRPQLVNRFLGEMESIGQMDHPNVVRATDAGEKNGVFYLVMEYLSGMDLGRLVKEKGPLDLRMACELTRQAALGLGYIHRTLVHRDIKPSNLMLTPDGLVKILDLGLARLSEPEPGGVDHTPPGCAVGTYSYMAPEQAIGHSLIDGRADIYSLGCTLFKLLTGRTPLGGSGQDFTPRQSSLSADNSSARDEDLRAIPEKFLPVLLRMTAQEPKERFTSAGEVAEALAPFAAGARPGQLLPPLKVGPRPAPMPLPQPLPEEISLLLTVLPETRPMPPEVPSPPTSWRRVLLGLAGLGCGLALLAWLLAPSWLDRRAKDPEKKEPIVSPVPDVVPLPPPLAPVRSLDALKPLEQQDLLRQREFPPVLIGFRQGDGLSSGRWMPQRQQVEISPTGLVLIQLGTTEKKKPGFTFRALVDQRPWSGWVGLFWGYQPILAKEAPVVGKPFARFQMLLLTRGRDKRGGIQFYVARAAANVRENPEGGINLGLHKNLARHDIPNLANEKSFEVVIDNGQLEHARFGGTELTALCGQRINQNFQPLDYKGAFGLITFSANMTFRRPWVMPHADN